MLDAELQHIRYDYDVWVSTTSSAKRVLEFGWESDLKCLYIYVVTILVGDGLSLF